MKQKNMLKFSLAALMLCAMSLPSFASGSDALGAGQTGDSAEYNFGKRIYATKIACDSCPMAGKALDKEMAQNILMKGAGVELTEKEKNALTVYVKRRFGM